MDEPTKVKCKHGLAEAFRPDGVFLFGDCDKCKEARTFSENKRKKLTNAQYKDKACEKGAKYYIRNADDNAFLEGYLAGHAKIDVFATEGSREWVEELIEDATGSPESIIIRSSVHPNSETYDTIKTTITLPESGVKIPRIVELAKQLTLHGVLSKGNVIHNTAETIELLKKGFRIGKDKHDVVAIRSAHMLDGTLDSFENGYHFEE